MSSSSPPRPPVAGPPARPAARSANAAAAEAALSAWCAARCAALAASCASRTASCASPRPSHLRTHTRIALMSLRMASSTLHVKSSAAPPLAQPLADTAQRQVYVLRRTLGRKQDVLALRDAGLAR